MKLFFNLFEEFNQIILKQYFIGINYIDVLSLNTHNSLKHYIEIVVRILKSRTRVEINTYAGTHTCIQSS